MGPRRYSPQVRRMLAEIMQNMGGRAANGAGSALLPGQKKPSPPVRLVLAGKAPVPKRWPPFDRVIAKQVLSFLKRNPCANRPDIAAGVSSEFAHTRKDNPRKFGRLLSEALSMHPKVATRENLFGFYMVDRDFGAMVSARVLKYRDPRRRK